MREVGRRRRMSTDVVTGERGNGGYSIVKTNNEENRLEVT
jgi:hypothetical protein